MPICIACRQWKVQSDESSVRLDYGVLFNSVLVELETMGAGAINRAVKAAARARQTLEAEGYALVVVPKLVQVRSGHGQETMVHLVITDVNGSN